MSLADTVTNYLQNPFPLWECEVTKALVQNKWNELKAIGISDPNGYSTLQFIDGSSSLANKQPLYSKYKDNTIYLETPPLDSIAEFYDKHGLTPLSPDEIKTTNALVKLQRAMEIIELVPLAGQCISQLVRTIQVLKPSDPETDVSYSNPNIPFTIFVSVCEEDSPISDLRVAESILHEAMHLKLTLIENSVPLIKPNSTATYYSPWRDEERPIRGVLHGLFVFRSVLDLYNALEECIFQSSVRGLIGTRVLTIENELNTLWDLPTCNGLTSNAVLVIKSLLRL